MVHVICSSESSDSNPISGAGEAIWYTGTVPMPKAKPLRKLRRGHLLSTNPSAPTLGEPPWRSPASLSFGGGLSMAGVPVSILTGTHGTSRSVLETRFAGELRDGLASEAVLHRQGSQRNTPPRARTTLVAMVKTAAVFIFKETIYI